MVSGGLLLGLKATSGLQMLVDSLTFYNFQQFLNVDMQQTL